MPADWLLRRRDSPRRSLPGGPMTKKMTRADEVEFYAKPENQEPQGPGRRRRSKLSEMVPVRFAPETLEEVRGARAMMIDPCRAGSVGRSSTSSSSSPAEEASSHNGAEALACALERSLSYFADPSEIAAPQPVVHRRGRGRLRSRGGRRRLGHSIETHAIRCEPLPGLRRAPDALAFRPALPRPTPPV